MYKYEELDYDDPSNEDQTKCPNKCSSKRYTVIVNIYVFFILLLMVAILTLVISLFVSSNQKQCIILGGDGIVLGFPYNSSPYRYIINFNTTIMQANYVNYISTSGSNGCNTCKYFRNDPYGYDTLKDSDYRRTGYDRGHLVPNADYGADTYVINNVVPMNPYFNRRIWAKSENYIRNNYAGYNIYKGCKYLGKFEFVVDVKKLYLVEGCYYVVLDLNNYLIDYGYYGNNEDSSREDELPYWISC